MQMWVLPDEPGINPGYEQLEIDHELLAGGLVPVTSGMDKHRDASAIRIHNKYAALYAARLNPGDAVRCTATGGQRVTAVDPAEVLVWEMHATIN